MTGTSHVTFNAPVRAYVMVLSEPEEAVGETLLLKSKSFRCAVVDLIFTATELLAAHGEFCLLFTTCMSPDRRGCSCSLTGWRRHATTGW